MLSTKYLGYVEFVRFYCREMNEYYGAIMMAAKTINR